MPKLAYFISPHGYGHAARASAVMAAIRKLEPGCRFEIFTQVPAWFFEQSLGQPFGYHPLLTDIGLAQKNSLEEDLPATIEALNRFLPFGSRQIEDLARQIDRLGCQLILCDIAPMGIAVARAAGVPSVLIENFTWDWIYAGYVDYSRWLQPHIDYLRSLFEWADYHIQMEPVCAPQQVNLTTPPVSRKIRSTPAQLRQQLGIPGQAKMVMMTMGGMSWDYSFLNGLDNREEIYLVAAGNSHQTERRGRLILLARKTDIFHPDLVNACNAVIGKTGYSTLAEVYQAGVPFGYVSRPMFRESAVIEKYIKSDMQGLPISGAQLRDGRWVLRLAELLQLPRLSHNGHNGAEQIARFVSNLIR